MAPVAETGAHGYFLEVEGSWKVHPGTWYGEGEEKATSRPLWGQAMWELKTWISQTPLHSFSHRGVKGQGCASGGSSMAKCLLEVSGYKDKV